MVKPASVNTYRNIFNYHLNIDFNKPKKDLCQRCTSYYHLCNEDQAPLKQAFDLHMENKNSVRDIRNQEIEDVRRKKEDLQTKNKVVACFDMEKVLDIPHTQIGPAYYKRKVKLYNFTVFDMVEHHGFCYLWNETTAEKGTDEIASCLLIFILQMKNNGVSELSFYCDNAGGQNRNIIVFSVSVYRKFPSSQYHSSVPRGWSHSELRG